MLFKKLCVIGVGLIGGSLAKAARERGLCATIVGLGREEDGDNLDTAQRLGVIDSYCFDAVSALHGADFIVIATPVGTIENIFSILKGCWSASAVYTDVGSTKGNIVAAAQKVFGSVPHNFVPGHPIAGAEKSGVGAAQTELFCHKRFILTPLSDTDPAALQTVRRFWEALGASVSLMDVAHHDAVLAATSHLPHILAYALVDLLGRKDEQVEIFKYAAGGFKDFTRIASSDPAMWRDICIANRAEIAPLLLQLGDEIKTVAALMERGDSRQLYEIFSYAKNARQRFLDQFEP
ncbi:MAG: prephenate dehydrogenase/arogenate dehydrogenase family protein [Gammaproteobacteria bacterium]